MVVCSAMDALQMMQDAFGAYRAVLRVCSEEVRKAAWAEVLEMLKTFETDGQFVAPSELLVAAATKPDRQPKQRLDGQAIAHSILHSRGAMNLFVPKE